MSKQTKDTGTVHQLHEGKSTEVKPPEAWTLKLVIDHGLSQATYFQKGDANTPLVRIVDVLADFAARHGLPAGAAVDSFLAEVNVPLLQEVYWLKENHFAELVGAAHMYGQLTEAEAQKKNREAADYAAEMRWDDGACSVYKGAASPLEAFKKHIQEYGPQTSDKSLYAVSHATANRLWGWGEVVAAQAETQAAPAMDQPVSGVTKPKKVKVKDQSPEWTGQKLLARQKELRNNKVGNFAAQTAKEAGLEPTEVNRRIRAFKTGGVMAHFVADRNVHSAKNKAA